MNSRNSGNINFLFIPNLLHFFNRAIRADRRFHPVASCLGSCIGLTVRRAARPYRSNLPNTQTGFGLYFLIPLLLPQQKRRREQKSPLVGKIGVVCTPSCSNKNHGLVNSLVQLADFYGGRDQAWSRPGSIE